MLAEMADGRRRQAWDYTSFVAACVLNTRPGAKWVQPYQINPLNQRETEVQSLEELSSFFFPESET